MKLTVYAVYDIKVQEFLQPFFHVTTAAAVRLFSDQINQRGTPFNAHPSDYVLYQLGAWEQTTGMFDITHGPFEIINAKDLVDPDKQEPKQLDITEALARRKANQ